MPCWLMVYNINLSFIDSCTSHPQQHKCASKILITQRLQARFTGYGLLDTQLVWLTSLMVKPSHYPFKEQTFNK